MSENTSENSKKKRPLDVTRTSVSSDVESAKILFSEGLFEEAKKILYQIMLREPEQKKARALLDQILAQEQKALFESSSRSAPKPPKLENPNEILKKLNADLDLHLDLTDFDPEKENWRTEGELSPRERYDLGVAFSEMGCYLDAIRELKLAERRIRLEQTFLGELGVSIVTLYSECLVHAGRAFDAKTYLEPILAEPDLKHEEKIGLFYVMGLVEEALGQIASSKGWFQKVVNENAHFRDAAFRLKHIK